MAEQIDIRRRGLAGIAAFTLAGTQLAWSGAADAEAIVDVAADRH